MNPRTTGILLLVAAALGAFVYLYEIRGGEQREEAEAKEKRLFGGIEEGDVTRIALETTDGAAARLERVDGSWSLVEPVAFPADDFAADGLAGSLADLASEALLEDPQPPEEYGLADGARVVRFATADGEHVLRIGSKTPLGSNSYARVEGRDEIFTVPTFSVRSFEKSLADLRDRRILDVDAEAVRRIEVRWPEGAVALRRVASDAGGSEEEGDEGGGGEDEEAASLPEDPAWRLVEPLEGRADDEVVNRLVSDLTFLRADGFVDAPDEAQLAGFETPAFEVALSGAEEGGEAPTWRLAIGPLHEGDERLVRGTHASLYTIPAERLDEMPREVVDYRYKRLSTFAIGDAAQVDFFFHPPAGDPVAITAERGPDGWTSSPEPIAPAKVARLVSELSRLDADDILSEDATEARLAELGLSPPNTIVSVFGEAEAPEAEEEEEGDAAPAPARPRLAEIHIGNVQGSEWIIARAAGDPTVYRLGYVLAEHVPVSLDAFRNRFRSEEEPAPEPPPAEAIDPGEFLSPEEESP